jgi:hypothetical protein
MTKYAPLFLTCFALSCADKSDIVYKNKGIEVLAVKESDEYKSAKLSSIETEVLDTNKCVSRFQIENYELKANSKNNLTGICANSKDGQHIHLVVDNKPYVAIYNLEHSYEADSGSHLVLAFLSRSHHQSIKYPNAYQLRQIDVDIRTDSFDLLKPYLFYSRPKGVYVNDDAKSILLDFYMVNALLSENGYKVQVSIDSVHNFTMCEWRPYIINGLTMGDHSITLNLLDQDNKAVKTPFLPVERKFTLQNNP